MGETPIDGPRHPVPPDNGYFTLEPPRRPRPSGSRSTVRNGSSAAGSPTRSRQPGDRRRGASELDGSSAIALCPTDHDGLSLTDKDSANVRDIGLPTDNHRKTLEPSHRYRVRRSSGRPAARHLCNDDATARDFVPIGHLARDQRTGLLLERNPRCQFDADHGRMRTIGLKAVDEHGGELSAVGQLDALHKARLRQ